MIKFINFFLNLMKKFFSIHIGIGTSIEQAKTTLFYFSRTSPIPCHAVFLPLSHLKAAAPLLTPLI